MFLRPPSIDQLAGEARAGPIVYICTSRARRDALILTDGPPRVRVVPLAGLTQADIGKQAITLLDARRTVADPAADPVRRRGAQAEILDIMAWLWDTITGPVLEALNHTATPRHENAWPRVWWCPIGLLATLPLHAAGHHTDLTADNPALRSSPRTVLDPVISSYTTTIRGLVYARSQQPGSADPTTIIIAVPDAPATRPLPGVAAEAQPLTRLIPGARPLERPTRERVLAALPSHGVAHFSCHGYANWDDPGASQLVLYDHDAMPLTVTDISALHLSGRLAFLCACDTTVTNLALTDEAVHITGAFHLAGYQHVIGTLWPIYDSTATELAIDFYSHLTQGGIITPDTSRAAQALHHATRSLRALYLNQPTHWAAYTHTGC